MCFAPQRRTFSTSQPPKMARTWCTFYILTSTCASRHSGVHFLNISTSKSGPALRCFVHFDFDMCFAHLRTTAACNCSSLILPRRLRTRRFSEPTFWPSRATKHLKNTVFHNFSIFSFCAPGPSSVLLFFDLFLLPFSFLTLPTSAFPFVRTVRSLTSKFPSIIIYIYIIQFLIILYMCVYVWSLCLTLLRGPCLRNFFPGHYWQMLWKNECTPQPQPVPHSQNRMIKTMVSCRFSLKPIYMVKAPLILTSCGSHLVAY